MMSQTFNLVSELGAPAVAIWLLLLTAVGSLIKAWPVLSRLSIEARAATRAEVRADELTCQQRIDAMERRLDASDQRAHKLEIRVALQGAAYRIVVTELHRKDPKSPAIVQAQALLDELAPSLPVE